MRSNAAAFAHGIADVREGDDKADERAQRIWHQITDFTMSRNLFIALFLTRYSTCSTFADRFWTGSEFSPTVASLLQNDFN